MANNGDAGLQRYDCIAAGQKLRLLRQQKGIVQFDLEEENIISQRNYSRIESGKVVPSRETLTAILDFFEASFHDRQEVLKCYRYLPDSPLPSDDENADVIAQIQPELDAIPAPAYLVDHPKLTLLAFNLCLTKLIEGRSHMLSHLKGKSLLKEQFTHRLDMKGMLDDADLERYLLNDVRAIKDRLLPYRSERWYPSFIAELCEEPVFAHYWNMAEALPPIAPEPGTFTARVLHPISIMLSDGQTCLHFRPNPEKWRGDTRYEIVTLSADDSVTMRWLEREMHGVSDSVM